VQKFISEDDLKTFEGWLTYQGVTATAPEELEMLRGVFDEARKRSSAKPKVGLTTALLFQKSTVRHRNGKWRGFAEMVRKSVARIVSFCAAFLRAFLP
jgi:hypothetical protein